MGIAMICVSYLDIQGNPPHLRYLLQRLRRRAPGRPILVGLWPAEDEVIKNKQVQSLVGADYYVTSLREAVDACVSEAQEAGEKEEGTKSAACATREISGA